MAEPTGMGEVWIPDLPELDRLRRTGYRSARAVLGHGVYAEDAADEAVRRLLKRPWRSEERRERRAWVRTTAQRIAIDYKRTRKRGEKPCDPEVLDATLCRGGDDQELAAWRERLEGILPRLRLELTPLQNQVLTRSLQDWSTSAISTDLSVEGHDVRRAKKAIIRKARNLP